MTREADSQASSVLPNGHRLHWYELCEVVGRGGFGITYRARDVNLGRDVAIKEFFPEASARRTDDGLLAPRGPNHEQAFYWGRERFLSEARTLARFRHPGIVQVNSVFEDSGGAYMVMTLEAGANLEALASGGWKPSEGELVSLLRRILDGLQVIHSGGFVHRDVKPENIIVRPDGSPVLLDFGSARSSSISEGVGNTAMVSAGYAPFEQYSSDTGEVLEGPWTDIYGVAACGYRVIFGKRPPDALERASAALGGDVDPLARIFELNPQEDYSRQLVAAMYEGLQFSADDRPRTADAWQTSFPIPPEPVEAVVGDSAEPSVSADEHTEVQTQQVPTYKNLRVMVVDDEAFMLTVVKQMLMNLGVAGVYTFASARQALAFINGEMGTSVDVVMSDLKMPEMDGIEFLRHLADSRKDFGVVLLSGMNARVVRSVRELAGSHGLTVLGTLSKPVNPNSLAEVLSQRLSVGPQDRPSTADVLREDELSDAIRDGIIYPVYLPKIRTDTREAVGLEALVRWDHPTLGPVGAGPIIGACGRFGLADALTDEMCRQAMADAGAWSVQGLQLGISINVHAQVFSRREFPQKLLNIATAEGVNPRLITLEVVEGDTLLSGSVSMEVVGRLRLNDIGLAVDDFGVGKATLEGLHQMPFTELKVEGSFVRGALTDPNANALVEYAIDLGQRLDLDIVAEGVETGAQLDHVARLGCTHAQGFHITRPLRADDVVQWIEDRR
jgi:EAL domain-containing protein (putative c-di-GMP-specific phosphodiesterase class I)/FixJ family two-component response regulator